MTENLKPRTKRKEASDFLDLSYLELQERDYLASQDEEVSYAFSEEKEQGGGWQV